MTEFEQVYEHYFADVYKYALSLCRNDALAEDITQETFFKALRKIDQFKGDCQLRVWLCQIAKNTYFTLRNSPKYRETTEASHLEWGIVPSSSIEHSLVDGEAAWALHQRLHRMAEPYKEVFSLRVFGELSFVQIAELFGKTESWARVTFHRAKLKLREEL